MQDKIYFFGYGAYRDVQRISRILGHTPTFLSGAIIQGFTLQYQGIDQIPEPAKKILNQAFGSEFKAYTLNPGEGIVAGGIWEITEEDLKTIKDWEFVDSWREIIQIQVKTYEGKEIGAVTEKAINSSQNEGKYDGLNYPNNINLKQPVQTFVEKEKEDIYQIEKIKALRNELKSITSQV